MRHTARGWERRPLDGKIVLTPTTANDGSAAYELVAPFDFGREFRAVLDCLLKRYGVPTGGSVAQ